jgi:hypothetical protein
MQRLLLALLPAILTLGLVAPASAHEERPASFPDGTGDVPSYLGLDNPRHRVVCKADSGKRISRMKAGPLKRRNRALLRECRFHSIQDAVNSIRARRTSIYVLPGVYTERKWASTAKSPYCGNLRTASRSKLSRTSYIGSISAQALPTEEGAANRASSRAADDPGPVALSYADQYRCPHNLNLIALLGDSTPSNGSIKCDNQLCGTQIVGTGARPGAVRIDNKFAKLNAIRADRVSGIYLRNFLVQQAEFNAVYFMEIDGFVADRLVARANDEYGILAFASDHGVIKHSNTYFNGDSGIYPGSASDLNGSSTKFEASRYAIEIFGNNSHHNMVGYSGTAGNSVYAHHNDFHHNIGGLSTDSLFPGHPGLPQDHAKWTSNRIYSNNENYYKRFVHSGVCDKPMAERGYLNGTVCPVIPVPVGTGIIIAGGNYNLVADNWIYDNWRQGIMQLWVPAPLRDEFDPAKLFDTSNHNHYVGNKMGITPEGRHAHNGVDFWWDDQGVGNCWDNNTSSRGTPTNNFVVPPASCANGGSVFLPGLIVKDAGFLTCTQYNRADPLWRNPPGCDWFGDPVRPTSGVARQLTEPHVSMSGPGGPPDSALAVVLLALGAGFALTVIRRRRKLTA